MAAIITIKRKTVIVFLSIVLAAVTVGAAAATIVVSVRADNGITIVLDAGHGGADGGVLGSTTGTKESDVNLSITKYLKKYLEGEGYNVVLTRSDGGAVGKGVKYNKKEDMRARREIVESAAPSLVISIHCNAYPVASVNGAQVFYAPGSETGKQNAERMQSVLKATLDTERKAMSGDYFILQCSATPSLLIECGFLSNPEDEKLLLDTAYREKIAYTIFTGINNILGVTTTSLAS